MRAPWRRPPQLIETGATVLPGYVVVGLLGRGRRTDTYDVYSLERDCRCVVKVLRPDRCHEQEVRRAVLREGRLVTSLAHPHLVRGYEVHEHPAPAMVLEVLGGDTLAALVEERPLTVPDACGLGLQLASALGYLHRHDWLHLDVKAANVVVDGGRVTLIDLGLAGRPGQGRPGAGTRGYLAPEQACGEGLAPATDVWGLGVTLAEALTGELPYGEPSWDEWRQAPRRRDRPPAPPVLERPDLPRGLRELLLACLEPDAAARPRLFDVRRELRVHAHALDWEFPPLLG